MLSWSSLSSGLFGVPGLFGIPGLSDVPGLFGVSGLLDGSVFFFLIVIVHFAFFALPSLAVAVIVTFPAFLQVTTPFLLTVATFLLLEVNFTPFTLDFLGETVAFNFTFLPTCVFTLLLLSFTDLTGVPTITFKVVFFFLFTLLLTVIVVFPFFNALILPFLLTVATFSFEDL